MLRSVDELLADGAISGDTWSGAREDLDERQLLDLLFTVGCYTTLAWLYETLGLELEPDLPGGSAG